MRGQGVFLGVGRLDECAGQGGKRSKLDNKVSIPAYGQQGSVLARANGATSIAIQPCIELLVCCWHPCTGGNCVMHNC